MVPASWMPRSCANLKEKTDTEKYHLKISYSLWITLISMVTRSWITMISYKSFCHVIIRFWEVQPHNDQIRNSIQMSSFQCESNERWASWYTRRSSFIWRLKISSAPWNPVMISVYEQLSRPWMTGTITTSTNKIWRDSSDQWVISLANKKSLPFSDVLILMVTQK